MVTPDATAQVPTFATTSPTPRHRKLTNRTTSIANPQKPPIAHPLRSVYNRYANGLYERGPAMTSERQSLYPFLKWAGGKRWFVQAYSTLLPKTYGQYFEPFLGSGAVFFYLAPHRAILSDNNDELVNAYQALRSSPISLMRMLRSHQKAHCKEYYTRFVPLPPRPP